MENLTVSNVLVALLVAETLWRVLKSVAPRTATTKDDEIVADVSKAIAWAQASAPAIWSVIEGMAAQNIVPKVQKPSQFLLLLRSEYQKQHGAALPAQAEAAAALTAQGMSAAEKLSREAIPAAAASAAGTLLGLPRPAAGGSTAQAPSDPQAALGSR